MPNESQVAVLDIYRSFMAKTAKNVYVKKAWFLLYWNNYFEMFLTNQIIQFFKANSIFMYHKNVLFNKNYY